MEEIVDDILVEIGSEGQDSDEEMIFVGVDD